MKRSALACRFALAVAMYLAIAAPAHAHAPGLVKELPALSAYLRLGVEHILTGYDHLLFLLGVIALAGSLRSLLLAVTAFTVAHSLSLALALFDLVAPPSVWVESAIALSIAYVGAENLLRREASARWRITFVFGFVHGFGFAGALREIGVPPDRAPAALALFNLGVELGQLSVLAVLVPALAWLRRRPPVWLVASRVLNVALIALGVGWGIQRATSTPQVALAAPVLPPSAAITAPETSLTSVYPQHPPVSSEAAELCEVFQHLPRQRRAECTERGSGLSLEQECTRLLSGALGSGAIAIDRAAADSCRDKTRARYADCGFVAQEALAPIDECSAVWQGQLARGQRCRSALECQRGLTCDGVGPLDSGVCAPAKRPGESCGRAIDSLAAYLPHREAEHPECAGVCVNGRCRTRAR